MQGEKDSLVTKTTYIVNTCGSNFKNNFDSHK